MKILNKILIFWDKKSVSPRRVNKFGVRGIFENGWGPILPQKITIPKNLIFLYCPEVIEYTCLTFFVGETCLHHCPMYRTSRGTRTTGRRHMLYVITYTVGTTVESLRLSKYLSLLLMNTRVGFYWSQV